MILFWKKHTLPRHHVNTTLRRMLIIVGAKPRQAPPYCIHLSQWGWQITRRSRSNKHTCLGCSRTHTHTHMVLIMQRTAAGVWKSWENGWWNRANQLPPEPAPVCLYLLLTASQWEVIMENIYISYYVQVSKRNRRRARRNTRSLYFLPVKSRGKVNMDDFFIFWTARMFVGEVYSTEIIQICVYYTSCFNSANPVVMKTHAHLHTCLTHTHAQ